VKEALSNRRHIISVEGNATGQLTRLIRQETGIAIERVVCKYDGRPFSPEYIVNGVKEASQEALKEVGDA